MVIIEVGLEEIYVLFHQMLLKALITGFLNLIHFFKCKENF
jgi:hypothetical protein